MDLLEVENFRKRGKDNRERDEKQDIAWDEIVKVLQAIKDGRSQMRFYISQEKWGKGTIGMDVDNMKQWYPY